MKTDLSAIPMLSLAALRAKRLIVPDYKAVRFIVVGCGGTGSWAVPDVVRIARMLQDAFNKQARIALVDPDVVEEKNTYRQNFIRPEIGSNKADTLMRRFSGWGVPITAYSTTLGRSGIVHENEFAEMEILIGCVDGPKGRREISEAALGFHQGNVVFWIDAGNTKNFGQVIIGRNPHYQDNVPLFPYGDFCSWLPLPHEQRPELLKKQPKAKGNDEVDPNLSCAELVLQGEQGLSVNKGMAYLISVYLEHLLINQDLDFFQTFLDGPNSKSTTITEEILSAWLPLYKGPINIDLNSIKGK